MKRIPRCACKCGYMVDERVARSARNKSSTPSKPPLQTFWVQAVPGAGVRAAAIVEDGSVDAHVAVVDQNDGLFLALAVAANKTQSDWEYSHILNVRRVDDDQVVRIISL